MVDKLELPVTSVAKLVKDGAYDSLMASYLIKNKGVVHEGKNAPDGAVSINNQTKKAFA